MALAGFDGRLQKKTQTRVRIGRERPLILVAGWGRHSAFLQRSSISGKINFSIAPAVRALPPRSLARMSWCHSKVFLSLRKVTSYRRQL